MSDPDDNQLDTKNPPTLGPFLVSNWKAYRSIEEIEAFISEMLPWDPKFLSHLSFALPFHALCQLSEKFASSGIIFGSNSLNEVKAGSFTEKVGIDLLLKAQAKFILINCSELLELGESTQQINQKIHAVINAGLFIIVCVNDNDTNLKMLLIEILERIQDNQWQRLWIAYEFPKSQDPFFPNLEKKQIEETSQKFVTLLKEIYSEQSDKLTLLLSLPLLNQDFSILFPSDSWKGFYFPQAAVSPMRLKKILKDFVKTFPSIESNTTPPNAE